MKLRVLRGLVVYKFKISNLRVLAVKNKKAPQLHKAAEEPE
jgi:hypothetical protein